MRYEIPVDASCENSVTGMGICSQSVAVAGVNGKLPQFLSAKRRKSSNMTNLLTTNVPKGRGRKGGTAARSRKPSQPITARVEMSVPSTPVPATESSSMTLPPMAMPHEGGFDLTRCPVASVFSHLVLSWVTPFFGLREVLAHLTAVGMGLPLEKNH